MTAEEAESWRERCKECGHPRHMHKDGDGPCLVDGCADGYNDFHRRATNDDEGLRADCQAFQPANLRAMQAHRKATGKWGDM